MQLKQLELHTHNFKKIIFRADGNSVTGLGHLYRTFALLEFYKEDYECLIVTSENSSIEIIPKNYRYTMIPENYSALQEAKWLKSRFSPEEYVLVTDGYKFNDEYQQIIRSYNYFFVCVDDFAKGKVHANIVINHSLKITPASYIAEPYTRFALGTKYAILRPEFAEAASRKRKHETIDSVFVCFGGADENDLTLRAVKALLNVNKFRAVHVIIGAAYTHSEVFTISEKYPRVMIHKNVTANELVKLMEACNLGIVSASNILYELCAVKMPIIAGYYVNNQLNIYNGCFEQGCIYGAGDLGKYTVADFEKKINEVFAKNQHNEMIEAQGKMFDGNIKSRYLKLLKPSVTYRKTNHTDLMRVFEWSNEKMVRANSYSTEPIELSTHKNWFEKKLQDEKSVMWIAELDGSPAGMVRYDKGVDKTVVGIMLAKEFRGMGLAPEILKGTSEIYFKDTTLPVYAYIKIENAASVSSFEKAGYKKVGEELVQGQASYVYKLEKQDW